MADLDDVLADIRPVDPSAVPEAFVDFVRSSVGKRSLPSAAAPADVVQYDLDDLLGEP